MHDISVADHRSSVGSNLAGPLSSAGSSEGGFSAGKMSAANDCSVAAASQNACGAKTGHDEYDHQKNMNSLGGQYSDFGARQIGSTAGGELSNAQNIGTNLSNKSRNTDMCGIPDDSKLLANPKGIIKSYLPQAAAIDSLKFDAYRELCLAHAEEYYKNQKGGGMWVTCHVCNTTHPHWNTLQRHLQTHIDFRPFSCTQCGRTFFSQSKLKRHEVIHSDVKPYKCPVCDRRLGRTEHLKRHLLVHTDDKPYGCTACTHTTKRLDGIRRHIKRKHGITGAEIVVLTANLRMPVDGQGPQTLADIRQVMSVIDENEQRQKAATKSKKKKKKKKKNGVSGLSEGNQNMQAEVMDAMGKDFSGNLLEVAARFGLSDLRLTPSAANTDERGSGFDSAGGATNNSTKDTKSFQETAGGAGGSGSHGRRGENVGGSMTGSSEEMKPSWDGGLLLGGIPSQQQMHLLYHSLARSTHPGGVPPGIHGDTAMNMATPCNLTADGAGLRQASFCHERAASGLPMTSPVSDHAFIMNGSGVPMRYLPGVTAGGAHDGNAARHVNPMLFSPSRNTTRNLAHFGAAADMNMPTEAMISQYIQSQQRFAPPVWGFANPNYHNY